MDHPNNVTPHGEAAVANLQQGRQCNGLAASTLRTGGREAALVDASHLLGGCLCPVAQARPHATAGAVDSMQGCQVHLSPDTRVDGWVRGRD